MEAKLKEYRARKRRQELVDSTKEKLQKVKKKLADILVPNIFKMSKEKNEDEEHLLMEYEEDEIPKQNHSLIQEQYEEVTSETSEVETLEEQNEETLQHFVIKWTIISITWLVLFIIFLKLQFGAVFFVISFLVGIYFNTRTRPRKKGEVSAYSVFNANCVSIDGTLKAEQFEREIRYGAGSVR